MVFIKTHVCCFVTLGLINLKQNNEYLRCLLRVRGLKKKVPLG